MGTANPPPYQQRRGFPVWAVVTIVAMVVVGIATVIIVLLTRDSGPSVAETSPPQVPVEQSDPELEQLAALLPPEVSNCEEGSAASADGVFEQSATAIMLCDSPNPTGAGVLFYLYPSPEAAASVYQAGLDEGQIPTDTGDCVNGGSGDETWEGAGGSGRIFCGVAGELASVDWTSDGYPVIGLLTARDPSLTIADVYAIWQGISDYS